MADQARIGFADLAALLAQIFVQAGVSAANAAILAENCAACERDGARSHGVFRMPGYLSSLRSGWVDGCAVPVQEDAGPSFLRVDARNGFAQPALAAARPLLLAKARACGAAVLAIRHSHHFSALWPDVEPFARDGHVAITMTGGFCCVAPFGSAKPVFGTDPIAFAAPVAGREPLVFDQATSAMAHGELRLAARESKHVAPGTGIDELGRPSLDPQAILKGGALLPFGGHKGAAIALMVEILAAALTGGDFSHEVKYSAGAETPRTGQIVILIDPDRGAGHGETAARIGALVTMLLSAGAARLPGDRRLLARRAAQDGICVARDQLDRLRQWADELPIAWRRA